MLNVVCWSIETLTYWLEFREILYILYVELLSVQRLLWFFVK